MNSWLALSLYQVEIVASELRARITCWTAASSLRVIRDMIQGRGTRIDPHVLDSRSRQAEIGNAAVLPAFNMSSTLSDNATKWLPKQLGIDCSTNSLQQTVLISALQCAELGFLHNRQKGTDASLATGRQVCTNSSSCAGDVGF